MKFWGIFFLRIIRNIIIRIPIIKSFFLRLENKVKYSKKKIINDNLIDYKIRHTHYVFENIKEILRKYEKNYDFKNKIILEIGPGDNLLLATIFILNGAEKVYLIDRFRQIYDNSFNYFLTNLYLRTYDSVNKKLSKVDFELIKKKIEYYSNEPIEYFNIMQKNSIDFIFSNAVLEHIFDLNLAIRKIWNLLREDCFCFNYIDLRDHFHIRDKCYLDFLKFSKLFYKLIGLENRVRYPEYIEIFNRYNFEIIEVNQHKIGPSTKINQIIKRIHKDFKKFSPSDLSIADFNILLKKKKQTHHSNS